MQKFYFSIIMAVYDAERYLDEAIDSLIHQTIGFDKIQLILINDGSPDESGEICKRYKDIYPENIVYVEQINQGVSAARNRGMDFVQGEYVNCLDSDDTLEKHACEKVYDFFTKHKEEVDVAAIPLFYFEGRTGEHILNFKFDRTRVIDLKEEYKYIQLSNSSAFIKSEAIGGLRYNVDLKYGEDAEFLNTIILNKLKLGVVSETCYNYRFRISNDSAIQSTSDNSASYLPVLRLFHMSLIEKSLKKFGYVPNYIQQVILYDLRWKIRRKESPSKILNDKECEEFFRELRNVLSYIDDYLILKYTDLELKIRLVALTLKYGYPIEKDFTLVKSSKDVFLVYKEWIISRLSNQVIHIQNLNVEGQKLFLDCKLVSGFDNGQLKITIAVEEQNGVNKCYSVEETDVHHAVVWSLGKQIRKNYSFNIPHGIDINNEIKIKIELEAEGIRVPAKLKIDQYNKYYNKMYVLDKNYIIYQEKNTIFVDSFSVPKLQEREVKFKKELIKDSSIADFENIIHFRNKMIQKKIEKDHPQWIFLDRINMADDNAEHLFKYSLRQNDGIDKYFILPQSSKDYKRLCESGEVIEPFSDKHIELMFTADMIISSGADGVIWNPLGENEKYFSGLLTAKRIFLQHGVTKDNLSGWLAKSAKNLRVFLTTSPYESRSILKGGYGYAPKEVPELGFPRFDNLRDRSKRYIAYMPTWNNKYSMMIDGKAVYNPNFKKTDLFEEIQSVLNNKELMTVLKTFGYKLWFKPHPNLQKQINDFVIPDEVEVVPDQYTYQDIFAMASALITDYSSVFFDFAYLKKPVFYYHLRMNHLNEGYFCYETMGFGEIATDILSLTHSVQECLENQCKMQDIFLKRVDQFFTYTDKNNCKRVYDYLNSLQRRIDKI